VAGKRGRIVYETGDLDAGIWSAGSCQGLIDDVPTVAELVERIITDAEKLMDAGLPGLVVR
jgi:NAD(P)H-dependent flavin oxidoreductase YrpB (nitropropane dioxygenase family)